MCILITIKNFFKVKIKTTFSKEKNTVREKEIGKSKPSCRVRTKHGYAILFQTSFSQKCTLHTKIISCKPYLRTRRAISMYIYQLRLYANMRAY